MLDPISIVAGALVVLAALVAVLALGAGARATAGAPEVVAREAQEAPQEARQRFGTLTATLVRLEAQEASQEAQEAQKRATGTWRGVRVSAQALRVTPSVLWAYTPDGRIVYSRGGGLGAFDFTDDERVGTNVYEFHGGAGYRAIASRLAEGGQVVVRQRGGRDGTAEALTAYGAVMDSQGLRMVVALTIPLGDVVEASDLLDGP